MNYPITAYAHFWHAGQFEVTEEGAFVSIVSDTIESKIVLVIIWHNIRKPDAFDAR